MEHYGRVAYANLQIWAAIEGDTGLADGPREGIYQIRAVLSAGTATRLELPGGVDWSEGRFGNSRVVQGGE